MQTYEVRLTCLAETDGVRCMMDERLYGGYCYYHRKMVDGLLTPSKEVDTVRSLEGFTIYKSGQKNR